MVFRQLFDEKAAWKLILLKILKIIKRKPHKTSFYKKSKYFLQNAATMQHLIHKKNNTNNIKDWEKHEYFRIARFERTR